MSRILIIVVAVFIVLAGVAITVMQQMQLGPFAPQPTAGQTEDQKKPAMPEPPRFVTLDPLVVPIFQDGRVVATVQFELRIETTAARESKLTRQLPRLTDAFITDLKSFVPRVLRDRKELDTDVIKKRLAIIGERALGEDLIDAVLIQSVLERKV